MSRLSYYILRLVTFFRPMRIMIDGADNTISILSNHLTNLLYRLGVQNRNHIYCFQFKDSKDYGFCILPETIDSSKTITRPLLFNTHYQTYGFECACPTVQSMFYTHNLPHDHFLHTTATPILTPEGNLLFRINI